MGKNKILIIASFDKFNQLNDILKTGYEVNVSLDINMANSWLRLNKPDLIMLDTQFVVAVHDITCDTSHGKTANFCEQLKSDQSQVQQVPIILLTKNMVEEEFGYTLDVVDQIDFPFHQQIIQRRVASHLALYRAQIAEKSYARTLETKVMERTAELEASQRAAVFMLGEAGHYNDSDTGVHIWRMAAYSAALAKEIGWDEDECALLELAAPMHDTGKIGIGDSILKKPAKLDAEQWKIMKQHTSIGRDILAKSNTPLFNLAADIAASHHERWDGTGYPDALVQEQIPWAARIVAIADVFDALTMKRPYKDAWPIEEAFAEIENSAGSHLDPSLVASFLKIKMEIINIKAKFKLS